MTDTAKMAIKIASGVAIVVITAVKIVMEKKNKPEESLENEETTEQSLFVFVIITTRIIGNLKNLYFERR